MKTHASMTAVTTLLRTGFSKRRYAGLYAGLCAALLSGACSAIEINQQDSSGNINQLNIGVGKSNSHTDASFNSAKVIEHQQRLKSFTGLDLRLPANLVYRAGGPSKITIRGSQQVLEAIKLQEKGGTLMISSEGFTSNLPLDILLTGSSLSKVKLRGAQDSEFKNINSSHFALTVRGSGDVTVTGRVNQCTLDVRGATDMDLERLTCDTVQVTSQGAADLVVHAKKSIGGHLQGAGDMTVYGNPQKRQLRSSGAFDIHYD